MLFVGLRFAEGIHYHKILNNTLDIKCDDHSLRLWSIYRKVRIIYFDIDNYIIKCYKRRQPIIIKFSINKRSNGNSVLYRKEEKGDLVEEGILTEDIYLE